MDAAQRSMEAPPGGGPIGGQDGEARSRKNPALDRREVAGGVRGENPRGAARTVEPGRGELGGHYQGRRRPEGGEVVARRVEGGGRAPDREGERREAHGAG